MVWVTTKYFAPLIVPVMVSDSGLVLLVTVEYWVLQGSEPTAGVAALLGSHLDDDEGNVYGFPLTVIVHVCVMEQSAE